MLLPDNPNSAQRGFTLIELISVIVILGVLSAVALPRFVDLRSTASAAAARSIFGTFESSAQLFYATCLTRGGTGILSGSSVPGVDITEYGIRSSTSASCYPEAGLGDGRISDQADCEETFSGLFSAAPSWVGIRNASNADLLGASGNVDLVISYPNQTRRCEVFYVRGMQEGVTPPMLLYHGGQGSFQISGL